jgi:hypothetical protein
MGHKDGHDAHMRITCALSNSTSSMYVKPEDAWISSAVRAVIKCVCANAGTGKWMRKSRRLAREVVELAWVAVVGRNNGHNVSVVVLVIAPALQLGHVAAVDDGVGGEQAQHRTRAPVSRSRCFAWSNDA